MDRMENNFLPLAHTNTRTRAYTRLDFLPACLHDLGTRSYPLPDMTTEASVLEVDWRVVFASRVRAMQALYGEADSAFVNWGRWSRTGDHEKDVHQPPMFKDYRCRDYEDEDTPRGSLPWAEDEDRVIPCDPKYGAHVDAIVHRPDFVDVWRRIVRARYYYHVVQEHRLPSYAGTYGEAYLAGFEGSLVYLTRTLARADA